jgi:nucleotide-binding universal stress UspA family protein
VIRNILICLDGSAWCETALELGLRWARHAHAELRGLGIVDEPTIRRPEPVPIGGGYYKADRDEVLVADARRRVAEFVERFSRRCLAAHVPCRALQEVGVPAERILWYAEDCDLTLLGKETHFHFETQSSADETRDVVLRHSHRPVVAVPARLPAGRSVLLAYDASPPAVRALQAFVACGLDDWPAAYVVSVARDGEQAARRAEEGARFLQSSGIRAEACPVATSQSTADVLLEHARDCGAGMVVMGAYGRSRVAEFFFGSTTRTVLTKSDAVLFLHH